MTGGVSVAGVHDVPTSELTELVGYQGRANRLAAEALVRWWVRERRLPRPEGGLLELDLGPGNSVLRVPVEYWSDSGLHRFGPAASGAGPISPGGLARLLGAAAGESGAGLDELVWRTVDSSEQVAAYLEARAAAPDPNAPSTPFLTAEQGMLAGDPLRRAPKSHDPLTAEEAARYLPELRGGFPLHWFAVAPHLVSHESELGPTAPELAADLARVSGLNPGPLDGRTFVPAHPWQAAELLCRPAVRELVETGALSDLGPLADLVGGPSWYPTSSARTVYRPDQTVMLSLSLGLRIADARRELTRPELLRGVEAHRLLAGELGTGLLTAHPGFRVLTDAGYLAVEGVPGLEASFRYSPFKASDYVYCVAALTDLGHGALAADGLAHELAAHLNSLAVSEQRPVRAVATEWFARYVRVLILPPLWLDAEHGLVLDATQRNTLLQLDAFGYPATGWCRGTRAVGYRQSGLAALAALGGMAELGQASGAVVADDAASARLVRELGVDNLLGVVGAMGCAGLADERELLGVARDLLAPLRGHDPVDRLFGGELG